MTESLDVESLVSTDLRNEEVREVIKQGNIASVAPRYLKTYVGETDWKAHLETLWQRSKNKDVEKFKQIICAAILLPAMDRSTQIDSAHPENLLFRMPYYHQLDTRDWLADFKKVFSRDVDINAWRSQVLVEGVIHPIEYHPFSRQAYNWLYEKAKDTGAIQTEKDGTEISQRFMRLVQVYGGAVICNIFTRHTNTIQTLVNWRSGYFFERNIYNVYKLDEILALKQAELQKANKSLVKSIKIV